MTDDVMKLHLDLTIEQQTEIYDYFTSIKNSSDLMYFETQKPVLGLHLNGTCNETG
jgi:hypothetical protein